MSAPAVIPKEIDLTPSVPSFPGVYGGIVIQALKGPVNTPFLVTNESQLLSTFTPNKKVEVGMDMAFFSALTFLQSSSSLWVVRAAKSAKYGGAAIKRSDATTLNQTLATGFTDPTAYVFDSAADVNAIAEVTTVAAVADVSSSLNNKYFYINEPTPGTGAYVWFNVGGAGVDPAIAGRTAIPVAIAVNATANTVAAAINSALAAFASRWTSTVLTNVVTITNAVAGAVVDATDAGLTTFTIAVTTQGADAVNLVDELMLIYGANEGAWENNVAVKIATYASNPSYVKEVGAFVIDVFTSANTSTPVESFTCSRTMGALDGFGRNIYVEDVLAASEYIRVRDNVAVASTVQPLPQTTLLYLGGGNDGLAVTDAEMIAAADTMSNPDNIFVTVLMDGGHATVSYQQQLDTIATSRNDCVVCLSTPYSAEAATSYINDIITYRTITLNLNSSFSALYTPHVKIYDKFNDRSIYASPDGFAAGAISFSAANYEIWFPPAGWKRGKITALDLRRRFTGGRTGGGEMGTLYDAGINPLRFAPGKGIAIWGQKTLLSRPSYLQSLNVRLLLIVIEPAIAAALESFLFELNNAETRSLATAMVNTYMADILARQGVTDFLTVCDSTNNSANDIASKRMNLDLYVKPTTAVEYIPFRTIITREGISFQTAQTIV